MPDDDAIIEFTIHVTAKASQETKNLIESLKTAKKTKQELVPVSEPDEEFRGDPDFARARRDAIRDAIRDAVEEATEKKIKDVDFFDTLDDTKVKKLGQLMRQLQNPLSFIEDILDAVLPARVQKILKILLAGGALLFIAAELIKFLGQRGGPLNRDFRRLLSEEVDAGLSRELAKRREIGIDQVIITQQGGRFIPNNEDWTYNSLYSVSKWRIARIGLSDRAAGVYSP